MPYQVVYTTTFKQANPPSIEEYLGTLGTDVLVNYPDVAGQTPLEVFHNVASNRPQQRGADAGFISETRTTSEDGRVVTLTNLWDSDTSWLAANPTTRIDPNVSSVLANLTPQTANLTYMPTAYKYITFLYNYEYVANVAVTSGNV